MAKCKCKSCARIVSDAVQSMDKDGCCKDVCAHPICGDPRMLGLFAPVIYDEIGINLCTNFPLGVDLATTYPTVTNATAKVINISYTYGDGNVEIDSIAGRPNCYRVTLSNLTVQFAVSLYDSSCRLIATVYPTAVYLPSDTTAPTYDEDTNPTSVELDLYAPYGIAYDTAGATPTPLLSYVGFNGTNNLVRQGVNLYGMAKVLDLSTEDSTITVGLTAVLQSVYYTGYKVPTEGKIDVPKGSILTPEDSDCMRFVAGDLLNLAIKPLNLGHPYHEERHKRDCNPSDSCGSCTSENYGCSCSCGSYGNSSEDNNTNNSGSGSSDETVPLTE